MVILLYYSGKPYCAPESDHFCEYKEKRLTFGEGDKRQVSILSVVAGELVAHTLAACNSSMVCKARKPCIQRNFEYSLFGFHLLLHTLAMYLTMLAILVGTPDWLRHQRRRTPNIH